MVKLHILKCGEVGVDPAVPRRDISWNPLAYTGLFRSSKRRIWMPVFAYLIEHPKGNVLIDTSWSKEVRTNPVKAESFSLWFASKSKLPMGSAVDEQIEAKGITANDLDYVILTHMDVDHVNGIQMVKNAKHILASEEEITEANGHDVRYWKKQWNGISISMIPFETATEGIVGIAGKVWDIFDDGTVKVIFTPGHSAGAITVLVQNGEKSMLIAGDTGYAKASWRENKLPGPVYDKKLMREALAWIFKLEQEGTVILASHDPEVTQQTIEL